MNNLKKLIKDHWTKPFVIAALFLICLSTSILIKTWFNVDGDYLSAFATLVAAGVAFHLYSDWRDGHNQAAMSSHITKTLHTLTDLNVNLTALNDPIDTLLSDISYHSMSEPLRIRKFTKDAAEEIYDIGDLLVEMDSYNKFLINLTEHLNGNTDLLNSMLGILDKYMVIMDIHNIKKIDNFEADFVECELSCRAEFNEIRDEYIKFLASNMLVLKND